MAPVVHGLEIEYWGEIDFTYMDIDDSNVRPFRDEFGFRFQPHLILLDGEGNIVESLLGPQSEQDLRTALEGLLSL